MANEIKKLTEKVLKFREERDWKKFHGEKDAAISLSLEAAEVMEHFQWKNEAEIKKYVKTNKDEIADELADVLWWVLLMSHDLGIDINKALPKKIADTAKKYPVEKCKGKHTKHDKL